MPMPAASGVSQPATASGSAMALYYAESPGRKPGTGAVLPLQS